MTKNHQYSFIAETEGRLDAISASTLAISRSVFSSPTMNCYINGKKSKKSATVRIGDSVEISYVEEVMEGLEAEDIKLNVLYEDDDILVIDKEQGMAVHPGAGTYSGTVANALLSMFGDDFEAGDDDMRPGIVHRLDKDTSGVMVIAKNANAHKELSEMFKQHSNDKYYIALVKGEFKNPTGVIDSRIVRDRKNRKKFTTTNNVTEGRDALTKYMVLGQNNGYALLRVRIFTGRTHQIRVHLTSINHPIVGDPIYGRKDDKLPDATLMLHAYKLSIIHPVTKEKMAFSRHTPQRFLDAIKYLGIELL